MKTIKVLVAIVTTFGILCGFAACAWAEQYPRVFIVNDLNYNNDVVVFSDVNNELWTWNGIEDWQLFDVAAAIMDDNDTPNNIYDDVIVKAYYQFNMNNYLGYDEVRD